MKKLIAGLCFLLAMSPLAMAQQKEEAGSGETAVKAEKRVKIKKPPSEKQLAHRQKMKDCSRKASHQKLKGDDRKQFMKVCLKG